MLHPFQIRLKAAGGRGRGVCAKAERRRLSRSMWVRASAMAASGLGQAKPTSSAENVDADRLQVRPPNPGVPQTCSSLERLDVKAVMVELHAVTPANVESKEAWAGQNECEPVHIRRIF
jgi:hypothetical protein